MSATEIMCQSCGMPIVEAGTLANGGATPDYCRNCFADGKFTQPGMTVDDAMDVAEARMQADRAQPFAQRQAIAAISRLKRWSGGR